MKRSFKILFVIVMVSSFAISSCKKKESDSAQSNNTGTIDAGDYVKGSSIKVPIIAWGADLVTINANGSSAKTIKGSLFHKAGVNVELFREDDFNKQVGMYIRGEIVFLRGTMGMINLALDRLNSSEKTKPVLIYKHSWSAGGDALVVKSSIKSIMQLKGKSIAIQRNGPHVAYLFKLLHDANLTKNDIKILWTKDFIGSQGDTPMSKLYQNNIDAAFVITPDALALTSNGNVGTGAEDSVKGARILLSTKTASRIIGDVYAVRNDYFKKNRSYVKKFISAMLKSEEQVKDLFKSKNSDQYNKLLSAGGKLLLDDSGAVSDVKDMYYDAEISGFNSNVKFFNDSNYPRNYSRLTKEIQSSLIKYGLLKRRAVIKKANWDYNSLKAGLRYADSMKISKFNPNRTSVIAEKVSNTDSSLFQFEIFFQPNQVSFSVQSYKNEFNKVIDMASTYGGALITVEGHSDTMSYLRKKKQGSSDILLKKIKQSAKNLSFSRASSVRKAIIEYASSKGISLDPNQLTIIGRGITSPKFKIPANKDQWKQNMRVQFKIIQVEAEEDVFKPL